MYDPTKPRPSVFYLFFQWFTCAALGISILWIVPQSIDNETVRFALNIAICVAVPTWALVGFLDDLPPPKPREPKNV